MGEFTELYIKDMQEKNKELRQRVRELEAENERLSRQLLQSEAEIEGWKEMDDLGLVDWEMYAHVVDD